MGRSGGSSGGHSSGGFGSGHSSGGFSGGGRSSSGYSSGGGFSSHSGPGPHYGGYRGGYFGGFGYGPRRYRHNSGCFTFFVLVLWAMVFILIFSSISKTTNKTVIKNTTEREKLVGVVSKTDWYEDQIGWISSKNVLIEGLEDFYNETGVQPYVLFVSYSSDFWNDSTLVPTEADDYLEDVYNEKFTDEAHFIFAYFECKNDSRTEMDGEFRYLSGYTADTIMDNEAIEILWGYFEKNYYDTSLSIEKMISNTFSETAKSIMSKPTNGWDTINTIAIVLVIIVVVVVVYLILKNKNQREKEKEKHTEEILSKPLETFGNDTSDLEDKYKK